MADHPNRDGALPNRGLTGRVLGRVVGSVVSPVVDNVDVDEVVERIDVNHVIERLDLDEIIERIDVDRVMEKVDVDALIGRIDMNALLGRIDVNALVDRIEPDRLLDRLDINRLLARIDVDELLDRVEPDQLLDRVDANRLLDRVDVDKMLERVDVDAMVQRVDLNAALDRVDVDKMLDRVDADRLVERVDVNAIVERTEIGAIIARSTTGVFTQLLDVARSQVILVDQVVQGLPARILRGRRGEVPFLPSGTSDVGNLRQLTLAQRAVMLQRHAAGSVSRFLAFVIDQFLIGILFTGGVYLTSAAIRVVIGTELSLDSDRGLVAAAYAIWAFVYFAGSLAATGKTIGKAVLGLLVVDADGSPLKGRRAMLRTIAFPLSFLLFGFGLLLGLVRHDRRELHDLIAGTAVIYAWDAATAQLRLDADVPG